MITNIWFNNSLLYLLLLPLSWLYGLITLIIRFSYSKGWLKKYHFSLPIVIIGNLTVGGNGKTPMVLWLVTQLKQRGWRVGVVSRGYFSRANHYPLIINNNTNSEQCGDEPLLIWQRTGVPVAVAPKRGEAIKALLQTYILDVIISDDGLQHYSLERNIEWVIIDGKRRFGNGWWLPAGPMRERATRLKTVQNIIVKGKTKHPKEITMKIHHSGKVINLLNGKYLLLINLTSVVAMAGISNPSNFFTMIYKSGINPVRKVIFSDHQRYNKKQLSLLTKCNEQLLMTEKDAVKCRSFAQKNWWYLPVNALIPISAIQSLLEPIEKSIYQYKKIK